jgi:hypothetical protein
MSQQQRSMTAFSPIQHVLLNVLGLSVTLLVMWTFFTMMIRPAREQRTELVQDLHRLKMIADSHPKVFQSHQQVDTNYNDQTQQLHALVSRIGHKSRTDRAIQIISECASQADASILSLQPTNSRQGSLSVMQNIRLHLRCDYGSLCQFLNLLHNRDAVVWVTELDVKCEVRSGSSTGYGVQKVELTLQVPHSIREDLLKEVPTSVSVADTPANQKSETVSSLSESTIK